MNKPSSIGASLLERAAEIYDFHSGLRLPSVPEPAPESQPEQAETKAEPIPPAPMPIVEEERAVAPAPRPAPTPRPNPAIVRGKAQPIDRDALREAGFIVPDAPVGGLAEEYRIIKRQLLLGAASQSAIPEDKRRAILVCSAQPDEGKTFSAINLALSLAAEKDIEVLLVDGDFVKPEILSLLGLEGGPGLIDAIADPSIDPEACVIRTDIERLSVLPAGRQANNVTELLTSERTRQVLAALAAGNPRRIVIFDSPPALMASPASVLATHVGQVMMVVRADRTTEADLREAVGLLSGCDTINLVLNGTGFVANGRRFGAYYELDQ